MGFKLTIVVASFALMTTGFALPVSAQSSVPTAVPFPSSSPLTGGGKKKRGTTTPSTPIRPAAGSSPAPAPTGSAMPGASPMPGASGSPVRPVPSPSASPMS